MNCEDLSVDDIYEKEKLNKNYKICTRCKRAYPATFVYFHRHRNRNDGFDPWCKECKSEYHKRYYIQKKYNITIKEYKKRLEQQKNRCAICGINFDILKKIKLNQVPGIGNPRIDHNHKTGKIRGLLCDDCNTALGSFQDNPLILIKAAKYLKK